MLPVAQSVGHGPRGERGAVLHGAQEPAADGLWHQGVHAVADRECRACEPRTADGRHRDEAAGAGAGAADVPHGTAARGAGDAVAAITLAALPAGGVHQG